MVLDGKGGVMEIIFKSDKKHRDRYFTATHFAHPAKMILPLQRWLIDRYTKPGDVILDPMAGCGTVLIGCTMGRHCILVELEDKFVKMQRDNWAKIQTIGPELGCEMGMATFLQGDARNLPEVLVEVAIFSPPYTNRMDGGIRGPRAGMIPYTDESPDAWYTQRDQRNIGNLPYGNIDVVITSPPYAESEQSKDIKFLERLDKEGKYKQGRSRRSLENRASQQAQVSNNISNLKYGEIDAIISSPSYEEGGGHGGKPTRCALEHKQASMGQSTENLYSSRPNNIGNLKGQSYLQSMYLVYQNCHRVLKPDGWLILVTKNFIRNKQEIRLDEDTIKLCEQAGFTLAERHYRKLTQQSFWRVIYKQKYPDAPEINTEDILSFKKAKC